MSRYARSSPLQVHQHHDRASQSARPIAAAAWAVAVQGLAQNPLWRIGFALALFLVSAPAIV
jgi:hypothetical protein